MKGRARSIPQVSVVIPAYQEAGSVEGVVSGAASALRQARITCEIIVVDDGSTDGTAGRLARQGSVRVVRHPYNLGYGAALKSGIAAALAERIAIVDGDGTYPVEALPRIVRGLDGHAMVVGARPGAGGGSLPRRFARGLLRRLAEYLAGRKIPDLNSGLRAFRRADLEEFLPILPSGFSFTTTVTLAMLTSSRPVGFLPVAYAARRHGRSKVRPFHDTVAFLSLVVRSVAYFDPLKIFLPLAGAVFMVGVGEGIYYFAAERYVNESTVLLLVAGVVLLATGLLADLVVARTKLLAAARRRTPG